jgi:hypothetical protein
MAYASGAEWSKVYYAFGPHLWTLVDHAQRQECQY